MWRKQPEKGMYSMGDTKTIYRWRSSQQTHHRMVPTEVSEAATATVSGGAVWSPELFQLGRTRRKTEDSRKTAVRRKEPFMGVKYGCRDLWLQSESWWSMKGMTSRRQSQKAIWKNQIFCRKKLWRTARDQRSGQTRSCRKN